MTRKQRIFLTGATGSMGLAAVEHLTRAGHEVLGTTRSSAGAAAIQALGATPVEVDLFDERALTQKLDGIDTVAHFATRIPLGFAAAKLKSWKENDRLRREGTQALLAAAEASGVRRFIFESISLFYADGGEVWIDETHQTSPPSPVMQTALEAEAMLEGFAARGGEAVSLRFGRIYGPGRASSDLIQAMQKRWMPIVGRGKNYVSSIHIDDVGSAVAAAVEVAPGVYNVVDDEPMRQRPLLERIASNLHAPAPRGMPELIALLMMGHVAPVLTVSQRVSNRRFREAAAWQPRFTSAAQGWPDVARALAAQAEAVA